MLLSRYSPLSISKSYHFTPNWEFEIEASNLWQFKANFKLFKIASIKCQNGVDDHLWTSKFGMKLPNNERKPLYKKLKIFLNTNCRHIPSLFMFNLTQSINGWGGGN